MKKIISLSLALALLLTPVLSGCSDNQKQSEASDSDVSSAVVTTDSTRISAFIDEGGFVIQIPVKSDDEDNWEAIDPQDEIVKLFDADVLEGTFVVRYDPVADGKKVIGVRHKVGNSYLEYTWKVVVKKGKVTAVTATEYGVTPEESK